MSEADYAGLITAAHRELHAPVILCWDNLNTHVSGVMRTMLQAHRDWLTVIQMPAYAPGLNLVEGAWSNMKSSLGNLGSCSTAHQLAAIIKPAQAHPVPARPHRRIPHPDRPQLPTRTTVAPDPGLSTCGAAVVSRTAQPCFETAPFPSCHIS
jgi:hypothetical protein